jgi:diguanylate cyclase (GGDEF)-like protein
MSDATSGTSKRRFVVRRLEQEFSRARRHGTSLSLALFEPDDGPGAEATLRRLGGILRQHLRTEDVCGRWGAAAVVAILTGSPHRGAAAFASRVRVDAEASGIKISAGISAFDPKRPLDRAADMLAAAERALGEARRRGGNRLFIDEAVLRHERRLAVIADPDPELLDLAEDLLSMDDFRVVRAECEATLLEALRYRRPDVLILDLQRLAEGEPAQLIERIRQMFPGAPVPIVGLASPPGPSDERGRRVAVDRFMTKPFSVSVLRSVTRDLLEQHRRARHRPPTV